jgi:hypothetical protein
MPGATGLTLTGGAGLSVTITLPGPQLYIENNKKRAMTAVIIFFIKIFF